MTKILRAVTPFPYNGEFRNPGDKFPAASESDADLLSRLGKVEIVRQKGDQPAQAAAPPPTPAPPPEQTQVLETATVKAEEEHGDESKPATRRERVYKRRDMRSEE